MKQFFSFYFKVIVLFFLIAECCSCEQDSSKKQLPVIATNDCWTGAGKFQIPVDKNGEEILYGRELIENTARYLGPKGMVKHSSNGMNCQNCHLEAGTKPWGNNFGAVAATYPKFRERSGKIESIEKRVNDCFERSLNGQALDSGCREMKAIVAYIKWLGNEVPKGTKPKGSGIMELALLNRPADPERGWKLYQTNCVKCHGSNGEGQLNKGYETYLYPPVWGQHSYNQGAGLFRLSRLAGFIKNNMPNPVTYHNSLFTEEEAWDLAAFINAQPRPDFDLKKDWPVISTKPYDYPFGPYTDSFSEKVHKFGPYQQIKNSRK